MWFLANAIGKTNNDAYGLGLERLRQAAAASINDQVISTPAAANRYYRNREAFDGARKQWTGVFEARAEAREIELGFDSLSTPRPGSPQEELSAVVIAHDNAQKGRDFFNRTRADFEIHGVMPHQWIVRLDPNRPIDPIHPWRKPIESKPAQLTE